MSKGLPVLNNAESIDGPVLGGPDKRVRLFKAMVVISQGMVILGIAIFLWLFREKLSELLS